MRNRWFPFMPALAVLAVFFSGCVHSDATKAVVEVKEEKPKHERQPVIDLGEDLGPKSAPEIEYEYTDNIVEVTRTPIKVNGRQIPVRTEIVERCYHKVVLTRAASDERRLLIAKHYLGESRSLLEEHRAVASMVLECPLCPDHD